MTSEFNTLKSHLARRPENEPWPKTYAALKAVCCAEPELMPTQEVLLDVKAVIIWATVCCERGFSRMKLAKTELQAAMNTKMLDYRLRIQMLGPQNPRKLTTGEKAALGLVRFSSSVDQYNSACDALVNKAIDHWNPSKHNNKQAVRNAQNGSKKLGSKHADKPGSSDPNATLIKADRIGTVEQHVATELPDKPKYISLEDSISIAPMPDVARVQPESLIDVTMSLLFELKNEYGGLVDYEWFTAKIKKCSRRPRDKHLTVEIRFPGDDGDSTVDLSELSDGKVYEVDWVLLCENKDGGMRRKKAAAKPAKPSAAAPPPEPEPAPDPPAPTPQASKKNKSKPTTTEPKDAAAKSPARKRRSAS